MATLNVVALPSGSAFAALPAALVASAGGLQLTVKTGMPQGAPAGSIVSATIPAKGHSHKPATALFAPAAIWRLFGDLSQNLTLSTSPATKRSMVDSLVIDEVLDLAEGTLFPTVGPCSIVLRFFS